MRGERFFNELIKPTRRSDLHKGRSNSLINRRNELLLARYYYYGHYRKKCYEETLLLLVSEFFLSPNTIARIIQDNTDELLTMKEKLPALYYFQNHWPGMKW